MLKQTDMDAGRQLDAGALRRVCDPDSLRFETTADLPALAEVLGQPRAVAAMEFGVGIASHGFNLFALGQPGSGRTTLIREYLERLAATQPAPPDLCYVHDFADSRRPMPLLLPAGQGATFKRDVHDLVTELRAAIPRAFDAEEYTKHRDQIVQELDDRRQQLFAGLERRVSEAGFQLMRGPGGVLLVPVIQGKIISPADLARLTEAEQQKVEQVRKRLQADIEDSLRTAREVEKSIREKIQTLDRETAAYATKHLIDELRTRYQEQAAVLSYLDSFENDVLASLDDFRKAGESEATPQVPLAAGAERPLTRYKVNVLVDNSQLKGAPVIVESNPTYSNLVGRIEHQASWGALFTDHTMIKAGALHRANGGYLIVAARECLLNPVAWEALKRALKESALKIEEIGTHLGLVTTVTLDPRPLPLNVKVVLIGAPMLYYLLNAYDEDFQKLFKVKADFTARMDRTPEAEQGYARFVSTIARQEKSLPFDRGAVARVIEYGARTAEDQEKLSTRFGEIADLVREAAHRAGRNNHSVVTAEDVRQTEQARRYRHNLIEEHLQEAFRKNTVLVEVTGSAVGRINGLSVLGLGDHTCGHPVRITAAVAPGQRGVISIEREVELSGPIHGKGVLILNGYLLRKYAQSRPLNLSASLVFEQQYSMVEGDSASLAELCVLLSAVSGVPLRQDLAVTGSVNQHGEVQAIGGVNDKIEGFFDLCRARVFSGSQGVLIPASNRRHLMLRDDVVEAVRRGEFHIWEVDNVEQALVILTGQQAGVAGPDGEYPENTVHRAVSDALLKYAEVMKAQAAIQEKSG